MFCFCQITLHHLMDTNENSALHNGPSSSDYFSHLTLLHFFHRYSQYKQIMPQSPGIQAFSCLQAICSLWVKYLLSLLLHRGSVNQHPTKSFLITPAQFRSFMWFCSKHVCGSIAALSTVLCICFVLVHVAYKIGISSGIQQWAIE